MKPTKRIPHTKEEIIALQEEYEGYEWAVENKRWEAWGLSRMQYNKYIRRLGLSRRQRKAEDEDRPYVPRSDKGLPKPQTGSRTPVYVARVIRWARNNPGTQAHQELEELGGLPVRYDKNPRKDQIPRKAFADKWLEAYKQDQT